MSLLQIKRKKRMKANVIDLKRVLFIHIVLRLLLLLSPMHSIQNAGCYHSKAPLRNNSWINLPEYWVSEQSWLLLLLLFCLGLWMHQPIFLFILFYILKRKKWTLLWKLVFTFELYSYLHLTFLVHIQMNSKV